jgi:EpsI family protein
MGQSGNQCRFDNTVSDPDSTTKIDRRSLIIGAGLTLCGGLTYFNRPRKIAEPISDANFTKLIPSKVGAWTSRSSAELILPPPDELSEKLYENIETRIFEGPGLPPIMFLIAYSSLQRNDIQVHRPEVCYPAAGLPITKNIPMISQIGDRKLDTRFLIADRGGPKEMILYWTRVGESFPLDWREQRIEMAKANLSGVMPDGALVRFSTIADSESDAQKILRDFATEMKKTLAPKTHKIFFGHSTKA